MATMTTTATLMTPCSRRLSWDFNIMCHRNASNFVQNNLGTAAAVEFPCTSLVNQFQRSSRAFFFKPSPGSLVKPISAAGSGLKATITDPEANSIHVKNAKIVVESHEDTLMQVRVDVTGEDTRIVFDKVLINLGRTAPPVPGFRRQKGGKTSKVPKDFLLQILGEERVTKFVIQEIITSTLADYAKQENLTVKDNEIKTIQTAEELRSLFKPGNEFGFNATLELETATTEETSSDA
ncbi:OLC1v1008206C2 [Oldenlandia corymbosa var. corymbosa]|uniref:peptidylprolyl isomerase n=1 Tax=Oldenlandia corymbosa var. corymbosa TaxID=529605 RepID=A0AAV1DMJ0_OLDCO|nr:OLC1v1008206C2 [Oldenlandia corymbosa var. corymbosa]